MLIVCCALVLWPSSFAHGQGIERQPGGFAISLSGQVQEAVENGVSLTFNCEFGMITRFVFFDWPQKTQRHQFVVTHHALSNRYIVRQARRQNRHSFRSLRASMNYISGEAQRLFGDYLDKDPRYEIRLSLSKYQLPGPFRLSAFLSDDWDLDTGWVKWDSAS